MELAIHRGCLCLKGSYVDSIAEKWKLELLGDSSFASALQGQMSRDGNHYHLTVFTHFELKEAKLDVSQLNNLVCERDIIDVGVGHSTSYYVIVFAPKLQKLRAQSGFAPFDFHITLGIVGSDVFDVRKGVNTLVAHSCEDHFVRCIEKILRLPSSPTVRSFLNYSCLVEIAVQKGYLFGLYYLAKDLSREVGELAAYEVLLGGISDTSKCRRLIGEDIPDYAELVVSALNHNIRTLTPYHKVRCLFASQLTSTDQHSISSKNLPRNFSFILADQLAGSSIPNTREHFEIFLSLGIRAVVTVMETPLPDSLSRGLPINTHWFLVQDKTPPTMAQMKEIIELLDSYLGSVGSSGEGERGAVLVHCQGGVGRTASVLAAYLMWSLRLSREEAVSRLCASRKTILTLSQEALLSEWYSVCSARSDPPLSPPLPPRALAPALPSAIVCVGYPGSGKSVFSKALCASRPNELIYINQDESGRRECEAMVRKPCKSLPSQTKVMDRCNLTKEERTRWLEMLPRGGKVWAVYFCVSEEECRWRLMRRTNHPTIKQGGGGARIMKAISGTLEAPSRGEGFDEVFIIRTFEDAHELLLQWGASPPPPSADGAETDENGPLIKFPRTRHAQNLGSATRDDLILDTAYVTSNYLHRVIYVEEKIDGANLGLSIRNNRICAQNRSHFVSSSYHSQFKQLDKWLSRHADELWSLLQCSDRYILYGEWVYAKHSIPYTHLPDVFVAFDMYDRLEERFWSRRRLQDALACTSIPQVPLLAHKAFGSLEELRNLVQSPSNFYPGPVEGAYLRLCDEADEWLIDRAKIVRADFLSGDEFWSKGGVHPNGVRRPEDASEDFN